jgi:hypothetical protein
MIFSMCKGQVTFQKTYHDESIIHWVTQTLDSGYIATGMTYPGVKMIVIKTNEFGDPIWTKTFDNGASMGVSGYQTSDGGYILTGSSYGTILIRTDVNGDSLWTKEYNSSGQDGGYTVIETNDSGFILLGYSNGTPVYKAISLIKTNSNGDTLWTKTYSYPGSYAYGSSIVQTLDKGYVFAGSIDNKMILVRTDSIGDTLWTRTYGNPNGNCLQMKKTNVNSFILVGGSLVVSCDSTGNLLWSKSYTAQGSFIRSIDETDDGGYILSGFRNDTTGAQFAFTIKSDSIGDTLWCKSYKSSSMDFYSGISTIDNGFIFGGANPNSPNHCKLVKTDMYGHTDCSEESDPFILSTPQTVVSSALITISHAPIIVGNPGFQVYSGSAHHVDCSSVNITEKVNSNPNIKILPNPASDRITILTDLEITSTEIYSVHGRNVSGQKINKETNSTSIEIDLHSLAAGLYFVKVITAEESITKKLVKH